MQLLAESKKGPAVHNSWQVFLLFSELLNLLSAFKAGLEGIFFSAGINCVTVGLGFFSESNLNKNGETQEPPQSARYVRRIILVGRHLWRSVVQFKSGSMLNIVKWLQCFVAVKLLQ